MEDLAAAVASIARGRGIGGLELVVEVFHAFDRGRDLRSRVRLALGVDHAGEREAPRVGFDGDAGAGGAGVAAQRGANAPFEREVVDQANRLGGLLEALPPHHALGLLDAFVDGEALGGQHQVVILGISPVHAEMALGDGGMRLFGELDLVLDGLALVGGEPLHHALDARLQRGAHADADHVRDVLQQVHRAPAADDRGRVVAQEPEGLVGGEDRQARLVGGEPLPDARLAVEEALHVALAKPHLVGDRLDDLVVDHAAVGALGDARGDVLAQGTHLASHGDQRHWRLPS